MRCGGGHGYCKKDRGIINGGGFLVLALLWLPAGVVAQALVRFLPETGPQADAGLSAAMLPMLAGSLVLVAPCGLPLALGCRRVWRLGYRRGAGWAWIGLGAVTVAASVVAGLLGPVAIAVYAIVLSLPVWASLVVAREPQLTADGRRAGCAARRRAAGQRVVGYRRAGRGCPVRRERARLADEAARVGAHRTVGKPTPRLRRSAP